MNKAATIGSNVVELFQPEGTSEPSGLGCLVIIARHHGLELSVSQLVHDNYLVDQEVSVPELLKAARSAGLRAQTVRLDWHGLNQLDKVCRPLSVCRTDAAWSCCDLRVVKAGRSGRSCRIPMPATTRF